MLGLPEALLSLMGKKGLSPSSICIAAHTAPVLTSRFTAHTSSFSTAENTAKVSCGEAGSPQEHPQALLAPCLQMGSQPAAPLAAPCFSAWGLWPHWGCSPLQECCSLTGTGTRSSKGQGLSELLKHLVPQSQYPQAGAIQKFKVVLEGWVVAV